MDTIDLISKLMQDNQMKQADLARAIGASSSSVSDWFKRKSTSYLKYIDKIAKHFDVTVDYLMTGNEINQTSEPTLTKKDKQDIAKHVDSILSQLDSGEALMFDGEPMNEETKALLRASLENSVEMAKITAKKKFTPKKYR